MRIVPLPILLTLLFFIGLFTSLPVAPASVANANTNTDTLAEALLEIDSTAESSKSPEKCNDSKPNSKALIARQPRTCPSPPTADHNATASVKFSQCGEARFERNWQAHPDDWQPLWPAPKVCYKLKAPLKWYTNTGECSCSFYK